MNSWKVILATMVIFGTGVITGGLLVKNTTITQPVEPRKVVVRTNAPPVNVTPPQLTRMEFLLRARNELDLTPEQHERIEKIIREGQEKSRKIWDGVAPELRKELQSVHEKIRTELTPEQRRRFEQLLKSSPRGNPNPPPNSPQPGERLRDRQRLGAPGDQPNAPRQPRRETPPPEDGQQPAPVEMR